MVSDIQKYRRIFQRLKPIVIHLEARIVWRCYAITQICDIKQMTMNRKTDWSNALRRKRRMKQAQFAIGLDCEDRDIVAPRIYGIKAITARDDRVLLGANHICGCR